jgi:hypothetical protein
MFTELCPVKIFRRQQLRLNANFFVIKSPFFRMGTKQVSLPVSLPVTLSACLAVLLFCLTVGSSADMIKVLKSDVPLSQDGKAISGAHLLDDRKVNIKELTICMR